MSSTHNHCFSHHHYQAWCHQIFFVNNTKIFVTSSVLKLQKWFLHQNGVESNQESKSDMYKLLGGVWRCVSYQKMCSRWLLAWYRHLAWLDIVANCAMDIQTKHFMLQDNLWASCYVCRYLLSEEEAGEAIYWFYCQHTQIPAQTEWRLPNSWYWQKYCMKK